MPNFHLHWLVGWKALDGYDGPALRGRDAYHDAGRRFADGVYEDLSRLQRVENVDWFFQVAVPGRVEAWRSELTVTEATRDDVTCFSSFMLGACGPDFWTLPSPSWNGVVPDTGGIHFDLGHYNRTHEQFRRSMRAIRNGQGLQDRIERSYFLGMATHVAADLVIHQLVNVSAGAYNLLKKRNWNHEQYDELFDLWNAHNKVEHFWDTYVRYRYFSDLSTTGGEPVFREGDADGWMDPLGFLVVETVFQKLRTLPDEVAEEVGNRLFWRNPERHSGKRKKVPGSEIRPAAWAALELPLLFPAFACDRLLADRDWAVWPATPPVFTWTPGSGVTPPSAPPSDPPLLPFVFARVVHKETGAYPASIMFQDAIDEAGSAQMKDDRPGLAGARNEVRKLRYFSTRRNAFAGRDPCAQSYMTYFMSPDLRHLRQEENGLTYGRNAFYDLTALKHFGNRAVELAKSFAATLDGAYTKSAKDPDAGIGHLDRFWNLDTGLGLEVHNVPSHTGKEVVTRLDFLHVFDTRLHGKPVELGYRRPRDPPKIAYLASKTARPDDKTSPAATAFPVREPPPAFASLTDVEEPNAEAFLDRIRLQGPPAHRLAALATAQVAEQPKETHAERRTNAWLDAFFHSENPPSTLGRMFGTMSRNMKKVFGAQRVKHRLTLELRVPISDLGDEAGMFLYCNMSSWDPSAATVLPHTWIADDKLAGYWPEGKKDGALRVFTARLLVNFVDENERIVTRGKWNGVVPYADNRRFYGRNFAVATGRRHVLFPTGSGLFDPVLDFERYDKITPTEHVFLSIYPLVKTPWGVIDAFTKGEVTRDSFAQVVKISGLEWKKIVLFYRLDGEDAMQLDHAFVDGLDVEVRQGEP